MTATPIPRTLHMAMLGLRDISSLATAPLDRRSIVTAVTPYNEELIRKAIIRELNRQGQVFFVHNRVKTIEKKCWEVQKLVPDAKVAIAHGQMTAHELEKAMIDFVLGKTDVLVCTTIIESGLDIPNANTMLINDADRFGLAELHQLRGPGRQIQAQGIRLYAPARLKTHHAHRRKTTQGHRGILALWAPALESHCGTWRFAAQAISSAPSNRAIFKWSAIRCIANCWPTPSGK